MIARTFRTHSAPPNWILRAEETFESRPTFNRLKSAVFSWFQLVSEPLEVPKWFLKSSQPPTATRQPLWSLLEPQEVLQKGLREHTGDDGLVSHSAVECATESHSS